MWPLLGPHLAKLLIAAFIQPEIGFRQVVRKAGGGSGLQVLCVVLEGYRAVLSFARECPNGRVEWPLLLPDLKKREPHPAGYWFLPQGGRFAQRV